MELYVSDGQSFTDGALQLNEQPIGPTGAIFSGTTVPNGPSAAANSGGLWDFGSYAGVGRYLPVSSTPTTTLTLTNDYTSDCLSFIASAVIIGR
ncbi:MAG: hypothetical protein AAFV29_06280 [Myxococcota bacterium]